MPGSQSLAGRNVPEFCKAVQRNLRSKSYERGGFSVKLERGVQRFYLLYASDMQE